MGLNSVITSASNNLYKETERSYDWLIKRALLKSKFCGNHEAEAEQLTFALISGWKVLILWENIVNCENGIVELIFGERKWNSELGSRVRDILLTYGRDVRNARELKSAMKLFVEGMAILKEMEKLENGGC